VAVLRTISDDTPILPDVVALTVVDDVARFVDRTFSRRLAYIQQLTTRAERLYLHNPAFRRRVRGKGNGGRDYLYTFMRHWYAGLLMDNEPDAVRQLRQAGVWEQFCNGQALPEKVTGLDARD
jgi:hypothetical protein